MLAPCVTINAFNVHSSSNLARPQHNLEQPLCFLCNLFPDDPFLLTPLPGPSSVVGCNGKRNFIADNSSDSLIYPLSKLGIVLDDLLQVYCH